MQNPFRVPLHHKPYRRAVAICALFVAACYPHIAGAQIHLDASAPAQLNQNASAGLPDAPGEDKKKYVMGFFSNATPAIQTFISAAIDQLWITWKASIAAGVTAPQEAIIADAVAKLTAINAPVAPPANPPA